MDLDMKVGGGGRPDSIVHVLVALQACLRLGALVRVCALCKHEDVVSAPQPLKTSQNMNMPTNGACPPPRVPRWPTPPSATTTRRWTSSGAAPGVGGAGSCTLRGMGLGFWGPGPRVSMRRLGVWAHGRMLYESKKPCIEKQSKTPPLPPLGCPPPPCARPAGSGRAASGRATWAASRTTSSTCAATGGRPRGTTTGAALARQLASGAACAGASRSGARAMGPGRPPPLAGTAAPQQALTLAHP